MLSFILSSVTAKFFTTGKARFFTVCYLLVERIIRNNLYLFFILKVAVVDILRPREDLRESTLVGTKR